MKVAAAFGSVASPPIGPSLNKIARPMLSSMRILQGLSKASKIIASQKFGLGRRGPEVAAGPS